jgi:drug/metabolite transporter (DMT)-like permease
MIEGLLIVALVWGLTNPFLRHYSKGIGAAARPRKGILDDLWFLVSSRGYLVSLLVNLSGSALFYVLLADGELSVVVPVCNSLTFAFTLLSGYYFFGERITTRTVAGLVLIVVGIVIMTFH